MQNWLNFYNLENDPFITSPIVSGPDMSLFFKTRSINSSIDPFLQQLRNSPSSIRVLVGKRGMGKTTTLHYIERKANESGFLTTFIRFSDEPELKIGQKELLNQLIGEISRKLVKRIYEYKNGGIYKKYQKYFDDIIGKLSLIEVEKKLLEAGDFRKNISVGYIESITEILKSEQIRVLILIDNLDKYDSDETINILLRLLALPTFQSLFEIFTGADGVVIMSLSQTLNKKISEDVKGSYSYLSDSFVLENLLPGEAKELLLQRFNMFSDSEFPIADNVIFDIVQDQEGINRNIIASTKKLLIEAASEKHKIITYDLYKMLIAKKDYESLHQQLSQDHYFKYGLNKLFTILNKISNTSKMKIVIRALIKTYDNLDLNKEEIAVLKEERNIPIKKAEKTYVIEDESIKSMFKILKEANIDLEHYLSWYTDRFTIIPEIIDIKESINETRLRRIINILANSDLSDFNRISYLSPFYPYSSREYNLEELRREMIIHAKAALKEFEKFEKTDLNDIPANSVFENINSCLWQIYNLYMLISSSKIGLNIDDKFMNLLPTRIIEFNRVNHIKTKTLDKINIIYSERYPVLVEKTKELSHSDTEKYLKDMNTIIEELTRVIFASIIPIGKFDERTISGKNSISNFLNNRINLSTTKFGILHLENVLKSDFMMIIIPYEHRWYCLIHGRSDLANSLRNELNMASHANFIFDNIALGKIITDTNLLVSKTISKNFNTSFFNTAEVNIPKIVMLEACLQKRKNLMKCISSEISVLETLVTNNKDEIFSIKMEKYSADEINKIIPPDLQEKQRSLYVDNKIIKLANQNKSFLITNDSDFDTAQLTGYEKLIYLSENDFNIHLFDSLSQLFETLNKFASGKTIRFSIPCKNIEYISNADIYPTGTDLAMRVKDLKH